MKRNMDSANAKITANFTRQFDEMKEELVNSKGNFDMLETRIRDN